MTSKIEKLKNSHIKVMVTAMADDLSHALEHALHHTTSNVQVKGFRPGKAPMQLLIERVGKARVLSEVVDHALPEMLEESLKKENVLLIEHPKYTVEKLCEITDEGKLKEGTKLEFIAEADYAPEVTVGDYSEIKVKAVEPKKITDKDVDDMIKELVDRRASFATVKRATKDGDRVEIDFAGKRNGIPEDRLASKNHPLVLGSKSMIPGFEDELIGKKAGDTHTFEIMFPNDYHAKDLAGEKVIFDVTVHSVAEKSIPKIDDAFAKEFGHDSLDKLKQAIRQEREFHAADEAKGANEQTVLDAFEPLVKVDLPKSLIEREIDRQISGLRQQVTMYGMTFDHYLEHLKKTEEELRAEMLPTAEKAVKIGLGLGEVVKREKLKSDDNAGYEAIKKLVEIATAEKAAKPKKEK